MKRIFIDMDGVLADYILECKSYDLDPDEAKHVKGFFFNLKPVEGAIDAFYKLSEQYDVYILTSASWSNPESYVEKIKWVNLYLPMARKRVIFSNQKNFCEGDYLIDDRPVKGASEFKGEWIQFGSENFPDWKSVLDYLIK